MNYLYKFDPAVAMSLEKEKVRQQDGLEMIPSENFVSRAVLEALGSVATNKYSEGYPGKRYYGGCQFIDEIETLAIERAKKLFNAEHVNVQPLSGAPANIAAYFAVLKPGDTILGMDLSHGGHLTHGHPVTHLAKIFNFVRYKTDPQTGLIDLDNLRAMALEHRPQMILAGFSSYSRHVDYEGIKKIADEVGAITMMDIAHIAGLIAGGALANPCPIFDIVTTTTHKTLRGPRGGMIMCRERFARQIDKSIFPGLQGGPHENVIAAKAVAFKEALLPEFKDYAARILKNTKSLADSLSTQGLKLMFGGTDNHLVLIDVTVKGITGKMAEQVLDEIGITVNKNVIPDDPRPPLDPSGIRLGTPALTTRGFDEQEMTRIGRLIGETLINHDNAEIKAKLSHEVKELSAKHPLYQGLSYLHD